MCNKENEIKFEQIITQAWNDYKGAVTAYTVLNKRFEEDLLSITDQVKKDTLIQLHEMEKLRHTKTINNHFNYFNKMYQTNSQFTSVEFCNKIDREISDIKALLRS